MWRSIIRVSAILLLASAAASSAATEPKRLALVIGNGDYAAIGALTNPPDDARLMHDTLVGQGFETTLVLEASQAQMQRAVASFGRKLGLAGPDAVGLFYFAGHGIQADGRNFLIPVEAAPNDVMELEIAGVEVDWLMRILERAGNRTNIVILDACRNNPFVAKNRSASRGLARVNAPTGSFIAYATAPGGVAADGDGANSPFTAALAKAVATPGKTIEQVFKQVRIDVLQSTGGQQTPWDSSSLVNDFYFAEAVVQTSPAEESLWESISESGDSGRLSLFLQVYPDSVFAPEARARIAALMEDDMKEKAEEEAMTLAQAQTETATRGSSTLETEASAFEVARQAGTYEGYEAFLAAHPEGVFSDLARMEMDNLAPTETAALPAPTGPILFSQPLVSQDAAINGRSIEELISGTPLFPPVEGLDESYWKSQSCNYCHNWTQQALCDQGDFYASRDDASPARINHPYGGTFKQSLADWAAEGCN